MKKLIIAMATATSLSACAVADQGHSHGDDDHGMDMGHMSSGMMGGDHHDDDHNKDQGGHGHEMGGHGDEGGHGHGDEGEHGHGKMMAGEPGKADEVTQVIEVQATDMMRFNHKPFNVKPGETVRFVVKNTGKMKHEFVIGTKEENADHRKEMMAMMQSGKMMMHADPNAISLVPGEMKSLIWKFSDRTDIEADCNIPGHYEGGMHTAIQVK